jgi:hypothetical protein
MQIVGALCVRVSSPKLLRRLESKGLIREPAVVDRPRLPSQRRWGGRRGYCYVVQVDSRQSFMFEGSLYCFILEKNLTYLYKTSAHI